MTTDVSRIDHSELGQDPPLEVEEPVSFSEADARPRIDGTGARDHEVQSAQLADEIQVHLCASICAPSRVAANRASDSGTLPGAKKWNPMATAIV